VCRAFAALWLFILPLQIKISIKNKKAMCYKWRREGKTTEEMAWGVA
jgi:hypothetical protein